MKTTLKTLLLCLLVSPAHALKSLQLSAGSTFQDYSFFPQWSKMEWTEGLVSISDKWGLLAGQAVLNRFGFTDAQGTLGGVVKAGPRTALELRASVSPAASVLPIFTTQAMLYQGLPGGVTLQPLYRYSHYSITDVHMASLGGDWQYGDKLDFVLRVYGSVTTFASGSPSLLTPAILAQPKWSVTRKIELSPFYSYRREGFQAGAPGSLASRTFAARDGGAQIKYFFKPELSVWALWQYESRIPTAYMREYDFGLSWKL